MFPCPMWEVSFRLETFRNVGCGVNRWVVGHSGGRLLARDGNTSCLELIRNPLNLKIDVVHVAKLLGSLFVV
jgi:hypothetical protein